MAQIVLDASRGLYVGNLGSLGPHRAVVAALLVGLDRPFEVIRDGVTMVLEATVIPPLTEHELEIHGGRLAALYFEPGCRVSDRFDIAALRRSIEDALAHDELEAWNALLRHAHLEISNAPVERRIARVATRLTGSGDEPVSAEALARIADLSVSRLEHLFKAQLGVPLRAYRGWYRMRLATRHLLGGGSLTDAAHAAGFHDSAHFARAFRHTFGLPPSIAFASGVSGRVIV
jgi:AraC-like DNA-binding protein